MAHGASSDTSDKAPGGTHASSQDPTALASWTHTDQALPPIQPPWGPCGSLTGAGCRQDRMALMLLQHRDGLPREHPCHPHRACCHRAGPRLSHAERGAINPLSQRGLAKTSHITVRARSHRGVCSQPGNTLRGTWAAERTQAQAHSHQDCASPTGHAHRPHSSARSSLPRHLQR